MRGGRNHTQASVAAAGAAAPGSTRPSPERSATQSRETRSRGATWYPTSPCPAARQRLEIDLAASKAGGIYQASHAVPDINLASNRREPDTPLVKSGSLL
jgi:hypothetical protein